MAAFHWAFLAVALSALSSLTDARFLRAIVAADTRHPVENVITMLQKLGSQVKEEGEAEQLTFQKFQHWCVRSKKELIDTITEEKEKLESLADFIESRRLAIESLGKQISSLEDQILDLGSKQTSDNAARQDSTNLYSAESTSLNTTIQAITSALTAMQTSKQNTDPGLIQDKVEAVMAMAGSSVSSRQWSQFKAFLQAANTSRPNLTAEGDYEAHIDKYSFKSGSVVELLKQLQLKFEADYTRCVQEETNAVNAHNLAKEAREDATNAATASKTAKTTAKGEAEGEKSSAETDQTNTQNDLTADEGTLDSTDQDCDQKATEWAERSKIRSGEQEAIETAIEVLAKVAGVRTEAPDNPVPPPSPVQPSFLQLESVRPAVREALELLRAEAKVTHSQAIEALAAAVAARKEGPFNQVINSIEKMIFHLESEQTQEDDHKNWCDKELAKTNASIVDKDDKITLLTNKINLDDTKASTLASEITAADVMVAKIVAHVTEATEIRKIGAEENSVAVKDAEAAQTAIMQAISVLKTFYKGSGEVPKEAWEFVQRGGAPVSLSPAPVTWEGNYAGVANPLGNPGTGSEGILVVLKTLVADFSQMESDTLAQEETDQKAFDQDVKNCKIEKARRTKESEMKAQEKKRVLERKTALTATRKGVLQEKEATEQYETDLQPACVEGDSTYETRRDDRSAEITALHAAQDHLQDAFNNVTVTNETSS